MQLTSNSHIRYTPIDQERHKNWFFESSPNLEFSRSFHAIPIAPAEFFLTAKHYPIAFESHNDTLTPIAILGIQQHHNLFLDAKGNWRQNTYIPALIRGYPFNIDTEQTDKSQLLIDEGYPYINQEGRGVPFFTETGEMSPLFGRALNFFEGFREHLQFKTEFSATLLELNILEPNPTKFKMPSGEEGSINNYLVANKVALESLSEVQLGRLAKSGILEPLYTHLNSLGNLESLILKTRSTRK